MGVSIYRLKELLGHSYIMNTMVYLHIISHLSVSSDADADCCKDA